MDIKRLKSISKKLSYTLRHRPDSVGLKLGAGGWVNVTDLIAAFARSGEVITSETLALVVAENDKQRFEFSADGSQLRARQGHSINVELEYDPATPPDVLFHGTATRFLESIFQQGLIKGNRHHVHLSTCQATMLQVGMRHGKPVLLQIDAKLMQDAGHEFYVTGNDVWLTDHVPPQYLQQVPHAQ